MSLIVVTPAESKALTTLAKIKSELGITVSTSDGVIQSEIDQASAMIERLCHRVFAKETVNEKFTGTAGRTRLMLSRTPVGAITHVKINDTAITDYVVEDVNKGWLFKKSWPGGFSDSVGIASFPLVGFAGEVIEVEYVGGYTLPSFAAPTVAPVLPADLEAAAIEMIKYNFQNRGGQASGLLTRLETEGLEVEFSGATTSAKSSLVSTGIPSMVWTLLKPWVRHA